MRTSLRSSCRLSSLTSYLKFEKDFAQEKGMKLDLLDSLEPPFAPLFLASLRDGFFLDLLFGDPGFGDPGFGQRHFSFGSQEAAPQSQIVLGAVQYRLCSHCIVPCFLLITLHPHIPVETAFVFVQHFAALPVHSGKKHSTKGK